MSKISTSRTYSAARTGLFSIFTAATITMLGFAAPATASDLVVPNNVQAWLSPTTGAYSTDELQLARAQALAALGIYHGSGSYICSPSGFGSTSTCFKR